MSACVEYTCPLCDGLWILCGEGNSKTVTIFSMCSCEKTNQGFQEGLDIFGAIADYACFNALAHSPSG
jgi:hypothetical protein